MISARTVCPRDRHRQHPPFEYRFSSDARAADDPPFEKKFCRKGEHRVSSELNERFMADWCSGYYYKATYSSKDVPRQWESNFIYKRETGSQRKFFAEDADDPRW